MTGGIYMIKNIVDNKVYIGSSTNIEIRWDTHIRDLNNNTHYSKVLQKSWKDYGKNNFEFLIIEEIKDENILKRREQYWIDYYNSYKSKSGYNSRHAVRDEEWDIKKRTVLIDDKLYKALQIKAVTEEKDVSEVIREMLNENIDPKYFIKL